MDQHPPTLVCPLLHPRQLSFFSSMLGTNRADRDRYNGTSANFQDYPSFPKKLIYPTNFNPHGSPEGRAIKESFIEALQNKYGMERVELNLTQKILDSGRDLGVISTASSRINGWVSHKILLIAPFFYTTYLPISWISLGRSIQIKLTYQWQWNTIGRDLVTRYQAANDGRYPPLDTARRANFRTWQANYTQELYDQSIPIIENYRDWFNNDFLKFDQESCSDAM